jgi:hypothetical protein
MEDQTFSSADIMTWIRQALQANAQRGNGELRVIFVHGRDPGDPHNAGTTRANRQFLFGVTSGPPSPESWWNNVAYYESGAQVMHGKVTIIDDVWACVGSANSMRRSLVTDGELSARNPRRAGRKRLARRARSGSGLSLPAVGRALRRIRQSGHAHHAPQSAAQHQRCASDVGQSGDTDRTVAGAASGALAPSLRAATESSRRCAVQSDRLRVPRP